MEELSMAALSFYTPRIGLLYPSGTFASGFRALHRAASLFRFYRQQSSLAGLANSHFEKSRMGLSSYFKIP
jgi:hypothetical protein